MVYRGGLPVSGSAELHEVIQIAMGWQQHHLHVFGKADLEYGDNARDETRVTLAP
ncbi:hypothetical protein ACIBHX_20680 [Nonomuraea sp. NPDC050536]|uniref:IS1096 element passenger TnpR family protein n=1 Tax=Nonomuraea sp. NPDC050536 TaxID=3364366 RepID=UPI0037C9F8C6